MLNLFHTAHRQIAHIIIINAEIALEILKCLEAPFSIGIHLLRNTPERYIAVHVFLSFGHIFSYNYPVRSSVKSLR